MQARDNTAGAVPTAPSRHPLVGVCVVFATGAWAGLGHPRALAPCAIGIVVSLLAWAVCRIAGRRRRRWQGAAAAALLAGVGFSACVSGQLAAREDFEAVEIFREIEDGREDAVIRGRVVEAPTVVVLRRGAARARFRFRVQSLPHEAGAIDVGDALVQVDWYGPESMARNAQSFRLPAAGEGWQLNGRMREVARRAGAPVVTFQVRGRSPATRRHSAMDATDLAMRLWEVRGYAEQVLSLGMDAHRQAAGMVKAMTLGLRADVPREVMDLFKQSGTVHVFSISGLHVGIVAGILVAALAALPVRFSHRVFFFGPMIAAYTVATGAASSAVRACAMSLILFSAPLAGRRRDPASSVSAAALLLLARDPRELLDLGFVFSFVCTAGILLMVPMFTDAASRVAAAWARRSAQEQAMDLEDALAQSRRPRWISRRIVQAGAWLGVKARDSLCVSLAAWIASTPVTAIYFGRIVPASILANLLVVPASIAVVVTAALSLVAGFFCPWLAETFNYANVVFVECLVRSASLFAHLPLASFESGRWTPAMVAAWYASAGALLLRLRMALDERR